MEFSKCWSQLVPRKRTGRLNGSIEILHRCCQNYRLILKNGILSYRKWSLPLITQLIGPCKPHRADIDRKGSNDDQLSEYLKGNDDEKRNLELIRRKAAENIEKLQAYNEIKFDSKHKKASEYNVNDFVMILNTDVTPGVNKKLIPKYWGPYAIKKVLPNDRYLVVDPEGYQHTQIPFEGVFDVNRLKPWLNNEYNSLLTSIEEDSSLWFM